MSSRGKEPKNNRRAAPGGKNHAAEARQPAKDLPLLKKVLFSLIAFVLFPLLLLVLVEAGLRLSGYGYSTRFLVPREIGGELYLVDNDKFGLRFFPPELARSPPPLVVPAVKGPGVTRVFVVGESAALGDPRPAFGPGRFLQALLEQKYPERRFEIVAAAMTAINSHALLPIVRECAGYDPDGWIIYMGNNEMVGPFGAASVFGARAPSAPYVRFSLALQQFRLGQWIVSTGRKWGGTGSKRTAWGGMKMFQENQVAPGDPRKETVYRNFRKNLGAILDATSGSAAPTILNTVAVNLKDCAPFASVPAGIPPVNPESDFLTARALLNSDSSDAARLRSLFENARDGDALPFRADSRINDLIRTAAGNQSVVLVDAAAAFASNSPAGLPGDELFLEHVHFNAAGAYLLARLWAEALEKTLPCLSSNTPPSPDWATQEACEEWLAMSDWNRVTIWEDMIRRLSQAPFTNQAGHAERMEKFRNELRRLRTRLTPEAADDARELYLKALARAPNDHRFREIYAEFLEGIGELPQAVAEWLRVGDLAPHHHVAWFHAGRLFLRQGKITEAEPLLKKAVALRPDLAEGWLELGQLRAAQGKHEEALQDFAREIKLVPDDHRAYYHMGKAHSKLQRPEAAIEHFRRALQLKPSFWEARYALGEELAFAGRTAEAIEQLQQVVRLRPEYPMGHLNLGVALFKSGKPDEALRHFEEALRLDPGNALASEYARRLRQGRSAGSPGAAGPPQ